jgi:hypothetical protein
MASSYDELMRGCISYLDCYNTPAYRVDAEISGIIEVDYMPIDGANLHGWLTTERGDRIPVFIAQSPLWCEHGARVKLERGIIANYRFGGKAVWFGLTLQKVKLSRIV